MRLEGYERRYGAGVRSVYKPGMQQTDMVEDVNREIRLEIEDILPAHPCLRKVSGVVVDVGDTSYGLGTLGRRYIDVVCRFGPATRDFTTYRRYCPGPSLVELAGIQGLTDGMIGELLRIRHGLKNQGQNLVIRLDEIDTGPPAQYPPYIAPQIRQYPKEGCDSGPTSFSPLTRPLSSPSESILSGGQTRLGCAPQDKFSIVGSQLEELAVMGSAGGGTSSDSRRDARVPAITGKIMLEDHSDPVAMPFMPLPPQNCGSNGTHSDSRAKGSRDPTITAKFFLEDHSDPVDMSLPLQNGRLKLATHKVALGNAGVERFGRWQVWKSNNKGGGAWKDITWEISVRGKRGDLLLFKIHEVQFPKDLDLHVEHL